MNRTAALEEASHEALRWVDAPAFAHTYPLTFAPLQFFEALTRYGDLVHYQGAFEFYWINDPACIKQLLKMDDAYMSKRSILYNRVANAVGRNSLITLMGSGWQRRRRALNPHFSATANVDFYRGIDLALETVRLRTQVSSGNTRLVDVADEASRFTLQVLGLSLMDRDLTPHCDNLLRWVEDITDYLEGVPYPVIGDLRFPRPVHLRARKSLQLFIELCEHLRQEPSIGLSQGGLFDWLQHESPQQILEETMAFVLAGHETSSQTIKWTLMYLLKDPQLLADVRTEIDQAVGAKPVAGKDWLQLPLLQSVVKEAQRLRPPVWMFTRQVEQPFTIADRRLEPDSLIILSAWTLHRHPGYWPNAETFDGRRFLGKTQHPTFAYIPFGGGPHVCIGSRLALMESVTMVADLVQRLNFELPKGYRERLKASVTLSPVQGLPLHLTRR